MNFIFFLTIIFTILFFIELKYLKKIIKFNGRFKRKELNLILIIALFSIIAIIKLIQFNILWMFPILFNLIYFSLLIIKDEKKLKDYLLMRKLIIIYLIIILILNIFVNFLV
jgi:hypothetical protein